jgi:hypothetical protein
MIGRIAPFVLWRMVGAIFQTSGWSDVDPAISSMYSSDASHLAQVRRGGRRYCETFCNKARKTLLADNSHCAATVEQYVLIDTVLIQYGGLSQLLNACVEGREKAFNQTCHPLCSKADVTISPIEGCKGSRIVSWCRKVSCQGSVLHHFTYHHIIFSLISPLETLGL